MDTKKTCILLFGLCVLCWGCSSSGLHGNQYKEGQLVFGTPQNNSEPKLLLSAYPRIGYSGVTMTFHVSLENVPVTENSYGCETQEWDFGDGAVSAEQPNCDTGTSNDSSPVSTEFLTEHTYRGLGQYTVQFSLADGKIRSNRIVVYIIPRAGQTENGVDFER